MRINPLTQLVRRAERRINLHFMVDGHAIAHDRKRTLAAAVDAGNPPTPEFAAAAELEGLTPTALATLILSKPDELMEQENRRRALIVQARNARTADELNAILAAGDVPPHFDDQRFEMI